MSAPKRRASARRGLLEAAAPVGLPAQEDEQPSVEQRPARALVASPGAQRRPTEPGSRLVKYSLQLDEDTSEVFDDLVKKARRRLGRHVDKAMIVRAVLGLMADDASLRDQVIDEVGRREN